MAPPGVVARAITHYFTPGAVTVLLGVQPGTLLRLQPSRRRVRARWTGQVCQAHFYTLADLTRLAGRRDRRAAKARAAKQAARRPRRGTVPRVFDGGGA